MIYQKPDPYPADWWGEKTPIGVTRKTLVWILVGAVLAVLYGSTDWDWVFGRR